MDINGLVDAIQSGDVQDSNNAYNDLMSDKINDALDAKRQEIANSMYVAAEEQGSDEEV